MNDNGPADRDLLSCEPKPSHHNENASVSSLELEHDDKQGPENTSKYKDRGHRELILGTEAPGSTVEIGSSLIGTRTEKKRQIKEL